MASTKYYKLWLRNGSAWTEVPKFTGMTFGWIINGGKDFSCTAYLTTSTLQGLPAAGVPWKITKIDSTDGDDGTFVLDGILEEPKANEQTLDRSTGNPIIWELSGVGWEKRVGRLELTSTLEETLTGEGHLSDIDAEFSANDVIINTTDSDTGPSSLALRWRQANALSAFKAIASLGDGTDKFPYYLLVDGTDVSGTLYPRVTYLSSTSSQYTWPNGDVGFQTSTPTGGTDEGRVLDVNRLRADPKVMKEDGRIINKAVVQYGGIGSGTAKATVTASDATSQTNFGVRAKTIYAPWIRDSATATIYANTIVDTFKGTGSDGILRGEAVLRTSELYARRADVATTANITLSGEQTIDGVLTSGSRVLVKDQSTASQNGVYLSASGSWSRVTDFDAATEVVQNATVYVTDGTTNGDTTWRLSTANPITVGTTGLTFVATTGNGFTAKPGDTVSLVDGATTLLTEKFLGFRFSQMREELKVFIGLPPVGLGDSVGSVTQETRVQNDNVEVTRQNALTSAEVSETNVVTSTTDFDGNSIASGATDTTVKSLSPGNGFAQSHLFYTTVSLSYFQVTFDGPVRVTVTANSASDSAVIFKHDFGPMPRSGTGNGEGMFTAQTYPFAASTTDSDLTDITIDVENRNSYETYSLVSGVNSVAVNVFAHPQHDLSHEHEI